MTGWYVVNTLPHQEDRAVANLERQGFAAWTPSVLRSRRHARRVETVRAALFPGYVFVKLDPENAPWSSVNGTYGVRRLICENGRPAKLPDGFVGTLRKAVDEHGAALPKARWLRPGSNVRLLSGPFADHVGTLLSLPAKDRVLLLMRILGREVKALVSTRQIAPAI